MTHDVIVCGAGPAGSATARRLASGGVRVALVGMDSRRGWEGLSARSCALLVEEGFGEGLQESQEDGLPEGSGEAARIIAGPFARRGEWANGRSVEGTEWLVERSHLARALRAGAMAAGADSRMDVATQVRRTGDTWQVRLRGGDALAAPLLVDARGRRGAQRRGPLLLAIGQRFRLREAGGVAGTGIGAIDAGWCWWARNGHLLWVQVVGLPRAAHPSTWVRRAAAQIPALARALAGASADGEAVASAAHARLGAAAVGLGRWPVGDAALALDPLSGQGVYEALRGARLVATAIQSVLGGGDVRLAQRFIAERHEAAWQRGVRAAAGFYRENEARGGFWTDAAAAYEALLPPGGAGMGLHIEARVERRPVLDRGRILERDVIVTAAEPRGVWRVAGVPVAELKGYLETAAAATLPGAAAALDCPQAAVTSALHWLQESGAMSRQSPSRVSSGG